MNFKKSFTERFPPHGAEGADDKHGGRGPFAVLAVSPMRTCAAPGAKPNKSA